MGEINETLKERFNSMVDVSANKSTAVIDAARSGNDIVFGEDHLFKYQTMALIEEILTTLPASDIQAITFEYPIVEQELYDDPEALKNMTLEEIDVKRQGFLQVASENAALSMLQQGTISQEQYDYLEQSLAEARESSQQIADDYDSGKTVSGLWGEEEATFLESLRNVVLLAEEKGIAVIAADTERERNVATTLRYAKDDDIKMSDEDHQRFFNQGVDDTTDLQYMKSLGVDLENSGIIISQRGLAHIDDRYNNRGLDDLLEAEGRKVFTVSVLPEKDRYEEPSPDPTDYSVFIKQEADVLSP